MHCIFNSYLSFQKKKNSHLKNCPDAAPSSYMILYVYNILWLPTFLAIPYYNMFGSETN